VKRVYLKVLLFFSLTFTGASCNVFDFMDSPSGDTQLLSAARACFNDGDLACAREYYGKLSADYDSIRLSEIAFVELEENSAGMGAFAAAFGGGVGGEGINVLARKIYISGSTNQSSRRSNLIAAYNRHTSITDSSLKALVKFVGATAILGAVFAEASQDGILSLNDVASVGSTCRAATSGTCGAETACNSVAGLSSAAYSTLTASPSLGLINELVSQMSNALNTLGAGGGFSTTSGLLALTLTAGDPGARCFRSELLKLGVGE
jgi:hypothetical protein